MSEEKRTLLPGTSYNTKDEIIRLLDAAKDDSKFFLHLDVLTSDKNGESQRCRSFVELTRDQAKKFIQTTSQMIDRRSRFNRMRVRITQHADPKAAYNSIWIG